MITLPPDFKDFLRLLNGHKVEYLLVGGYAVALHGYVRFTADMDIWVMTSPENAAKVVQALKDFGIPQANELYNIFLLEKRVLGMGMPPYKIEVVTTIDGVSFEECSANRMTVEIDDITVPYLSLNDLRKNKKASGRYKDLNDLEHLPEEE
jgi:aminoglycoside-2''-adenylyltransferase